MQPEVGIVSAPIATLLSIPIGSITYWFTQRSPIPKKICTAELSPEGLGDTRWILPITSCLSEGKQGPLLKKNQIFYQINLIKVGMVGVAQSGVGEIFHYLLYMGHVAVAWACAASRSGSGYGGNDK